MVALKSSISTKYVPEGELFDQVYFFTGVFCNLPKLYEEFCYHNKIIIKQAGYGNINFLSLTSKILQVWRCKISISMKLYPNSKSLLSLTMDDKA